MAHHLVQSFAMWSQYFVSGYPTAGNFFQTQNQRFCGRAAQQALLHGISNIRAGIDLHSTVQCTSLQQNAEGLHLFCSCTMSKACDVAHVSDKPFGIVEVDAFADRHTSGGFLFLTVGTTMFPALVEAVCTPEFCAIARRKHGITGMLI